MSDTDSDLRPPAGHVQAPGTKWTPSDPQQIVDAATFFAWKAAQCVAEAEEYRVRTLSTPADAARARRDAEREQRKQEQRVRLTAEYAARDAKIAARLQPADAEAPMLTRGVRARHTQEESLF